MLYWESTTSLISELYFKTAISLRAAEKERGETLGIKYKCHMVGFLHKVRPPSLKKKSVHYKRQLRGLGKVDIQSIWIFTKITSKKFTVHIYDGVLGHIRKKKKENLL